MVGGWALTVASTVCVHEHACVWCWCECVVRFAHVSYRPHMAHATNQVNGSSARLGGGYTTPVVYFKFLGVCDPSDVAKDVHALLANVTVSRGPDLLNQRHEHWVTHGSRIPPCARDDTTTHAPALVNIPHKTNVPLGNDHGSLNDKNLNKASLSNQPHLVMVSIDWCACVFACACVSECECVRLISFHIHIPFFVRDFLPRKN